MDQKVKRYSHPIVQYPQFSMKGLYKFFYFGGRPGLVRFLNNGLYLLDEMLCEVNEIYNDIFCFQPFSCIGLKKIISTVDRSKLNQHCDSRYTHSASCCS